MKYSVLFALIFNTAVNCAMVREFPYDVFNETEIENSTALEDMNAMSSIVTEVVEHLIHLDETNDTMFDSNLNLTANASPLLSALRSFWAQASVGLLDSMGEPEEPVNKHVQKQVFRAIEHGLFEATTMLMNQMEETTLPTLSSTEPEKKEPKAILTDRLGDISLDSEEIIDANFDVKDKRQNVFDFMANVSTSCSNCYEELNTCVQQCFISHNCHDIQRGIRACPPTPSRLCNPFTQWNPVDECKTHSDCKSPLLCCNDGCINKCLPGVWSS